jgi:hypothetical protein
MRHTAVRFGKYTNYRSKDRDVVIHVNGAWGDAAKCMQRCAHTKTT